MSVSNSASYNYSEQEILTFNSETDFIKAFSNVYAIWELYLITGLQSAAPNRICEFSIERITETPDGLLIKVNTPIPIPLLAPHFPHKEYFIYHPIEVSGVEINSTARALSGYCKIRPSGIKNDVYAEITYEGNNQFTLYIAESELVMATNDKGLPDSATYLIKRK